MLNLIANTSKEKEIYNMISPFIFDKGLRIVKIQFLKDKDFKLSIFLDKIDGKVTIDECAAISTEINSLLDIEGIIKNPFRLEISSAGIDRYLSSLNDFMKYQNYNVRVKCTKNISRGKLINYSPDTLTLSNKNGERDIVLSSVLDVKLDLEGMSLETIKEMEFK